jgi:hypothetical protein
MATQTRKRIADKPVTLRKLHVVTSIGREKNNELEADLRRMGCPGYGKNIEEYAVRRW